MEKSQSRSPNSPEGSGTRVVPLLRDGRGRDGKYPLFKVLLMFPGRLENI